MPPAAGCEEMLRGSVSGFLPLFRNESRSWQMGLVTRLEMTSTEVKSSPGSGF